MNADEHVTHALVFEGESPSRPTLAAQCFQGGEGGAESFLPSFEEAKDRLLACLRDSADGKQRLLLKSLSRSAKPERGDHNRAHHVDSNEYQSEMVSNG
ncbi:MAG TPA: hypothetical protein VEL79_05215 [Vicinamibacterales bacterium]|nr:hypothetical protein [Vicinamibacterales bacterium]